MKFIYSLLIIAVCFNLSGCKVNRYYFIAEEKIPLYEFSSFRGLPILETQIGDTVSSTGPKVMQLGGRVPVEYRGYSFFAPHAKARFVKRIKIDPKQSEILSGITYLPRQRQKAQEEAWLNRPSEEITSEWYGQVDYTVPVLVEPEAIAQTVHTLSPKSIVRIYWHNESYWRVEYGDGKIGYVSYYYIQKYSKSKSPFVATAYKGPFGKSDRHSPRYNTPTTGATIHTGPRGGRYYINSNGNKTYVPRNGSSRSSYGGYRSRSSGTYRRSGGRGRR